MGGWVAAARFGSGYVTGARCWCPVPMSRAPDEWWTGWIVWGTKSWDEFYGCLTFEKLICVLTTHEPTRSWRAGGGGGRTASAGGAGDVLGDLLAGEHLGPVEGREERVGQHSVAPGPLPLPPPVSPVEQQPPLRKSKPIK